MNLQEKYLSAIATLRCLIVQLSSFVCLQPGLNLVRVRSDEQGKINTHYMFVVFVAAVMLLAMVAQVANHVNAMISPVIYAM